MTNDRPDFVVIDKTKTCISILELTVPFENNVNCNYEYKCHKYTRLCIDLQRLGFKVKYFAIEIGCRAVISDSNSKHLYAFYKSIKGLKFNNREFRHPKTFLCKTVITSSFVIFKSKYCNPGSHLCLIVMCKMILTWQHYCTYSSI